MKYSITAFLLVFAMHFATAQETWTLEKCIEYALEHNLTVKQTELNLRTAEQNELQSKGNRLPSLNASGGYIFNTGRSIDPFTNQFTTSTIQSGNFGISSSMTLFNGLQNYHSVQRSHLEAMAAKFDLDAVKNDISINVALGYLNILLASEALKNAEEQLSLSTDQVKRIQALVDAGSLPSGDLYDINAQLAVDEQNLVNAENQLDLANLNMGILLELDDPAAFKASKVDFKMPDGKLLRMDPENIFQAAVNNQPSLQAASIRILSSEKSLSIAKGGLSPRLTVNLSANSGFSDGRQEVTQNQLIGFDTIFTAQGDYITSPIFQPTFRTTPYGDQLTDNLSRTASINLTIPIFNGWANKTNINRAEIGVLSARYSYEQTENNLRQSIYQAHTDAKAALKRYNASLRAVDARREAFDYAVIRFDQGIINSFDYNNAKTGLIQAESDLLQAKYDYIFKLRVLEFYYNSSLNY
mgnify:CR=1 FL=1